jgi:hypothetical protein
MAVATAPPAPSTDVLLAALAGFPSTDGWDVVCSYGLDALNRVLAKAHAAGSLPATLPEFSVDRTDPITGDKFKESFDMVLDAPTLEFVGGDSAACVLTMPITSCAWKMEKPDGSPIRNASAAAGYSLVATVSLGGMYADGTSSTGDVVTWDANDSRKAHVVVHFPSGSGSGTTWQITPEPSDDDTQMLDALPYIQEHFATQVNALDYQLAGIDPTPPAAAGGGLVLNAKSFAFSTSAGVLSLFIQTTNSGAPPGATHPVFRAGGQELAAVPDGHEASVLFGREFARKLYVGPGLAQSGTVTWDESVASGFAAKLVIPVPRFSYDPSYNEAFQQFGCETVVIDYSTLPYTVVVKDNELSVTWNWSQQVKWDKYDVDPSTGDTIREGGRTVLSLALATSAQLPAPTDSAITASTAISAGDYKLTAEGPDGWYSAGPGVASQITNYLASNNSERSINISLGSLNHFTVSNLLFGGNQVFQVDATAGTNVPADIVIFGNLEDGS